VVHGGIGNGLHGLAVKIGAAARGLDAQGLLAGYCRILHERHGTYEEVARRTNPDRRTVKKYLRQQ